MGLLMQWQVQNEGVDSQQLSHHITEPGVIWQQLMLWDECSRQDFPLETVYKGRNVTITLKSYLKSLNQTLDDSVEVAFSAHLLIWLINENGQYNSDWKLTAYVNQKASRS